MDHVLTVTLEMLVPERRALNRGTTRERLMEAAKAFVNTAEDEGVGIDVDDVSMAVSYDYHRFGYDEPVPYDGSS